MGPLCQIKSKEDNSGPSGCNHKGLTSVKLLLRSTEDDHVRDPQMILSPRRRTSHPTPIWPTLATAAAMLMVGAMVFV